jgi:hypothetical protein
MACKINKEHKDCLYWIYPLLILAAIIITGLNKNHTHEIDAITGADFNINSTTGINKNIRIPDSLLNKEFIDSNTIFFARE